MNIEITDIKYDPKLVISFSVGDEVTRVSNTQKKLPWLREHYGESNSRLPKGISEESNVQDVSNAVSSEFSEGDYVDYSQYIQARWPQCSVGLLRLKELAGFMLRDDYRLLLTKYGTGGSYNSKNGEIIVNIASKTKEKVIGAIIHEIVHIGIEYLINEYKIQHWYKERLVDLICERYFPGARKMQDIKIDVGTVDRAFEQSFPNLETIVRSMGSESL